MTAQDYLRDMVAIESTRGKESGMADYLEPVLVRLGFSIGRDPARARRRNILATRGDQPTLLCYGHMDTVPVYAGWDTDPFVLTERDGRLYGLGAHDMKGGIAALLAAIEQLPRELPLKLIFCYDEEYDSDGAWHVANHRSDWFDGLANALSAESGTAAGNSYATPHIILGRRGRARYQVSIGGFSAHGGNAERGVSAISLASQLIPLLESAPMATQAQLGIGSQYVASIGAGNAGLSVPDTCVLEIERHFVQPETVQSVLHGYQAICDEFLSGLDLTAEQRELVSVSVRVKERANPYMTPFVTPLDNSFVSAARQAADAVFGRHEIAYGRSVADDNILANKLGLDVIISGPIGGNEHSPNEWVDTARLEDYVQFYKTLLTGTSAHAHA